MLFTAPGEHIHWTTGTLHCQLLLNNQREESQQVLGRKGDEQQTELIIASKVPYHEVVDKHINNWEIIIAAIIITDDDTMIILCVIDTLFHRNCVGLGLNVSF